LTISGAIIDLGALFNALLNCMRVQKLRTPNLPRHNCAQSDKKRLLIEMQLLQNLHGAIWTACVCALVSADETQTKFIISDHPVTLESARGMCYNVYLSIIPPGTR
jgi:hypothetical protein